MDFLVWLKANIEVILMGAAGATIGALISEKPYKERLISFLVGFILCVSLSDYTAMFLTGGKYTGLFGFLYGLGGISIAKMILTSWEKRFKTEIKSKTGVDLDDDAH